VRVVSNHARAEADHPHPVTGQEIGSPVPPGSGWPDDPAEPGTPIAHDASAVAGLAAASTSLEEVSARSSVCRACPRLVTWREEVAAGKRRAFQDEPYWGRPVPGWGDDAPRVLVVGLAPAAHGGNRTGRIFTGDRSGDWLFASMHRVGLANQPSSVHSGDGLQLRDTRLVAAVRCAPPANKPTPAERDACAQWLDREVALVLDSVRAIVALGSYAWDAALGTLARNGLAVPRPRPRFGHGAEARIGSMSLLGSYHPSQQNTFTGKLTEQMLDAVLGAAAGRAGVSQ
jgi:uracil-DNA glycosylase family 4